MVLSRLAQYERHHTQGAESVSVSVKTTLALVLNSAITPVLLYANFEMGDAMPSILGIGAGEHDDFSPRWYATVGAGICVTMLFSIFTANWYPVYEFVFNQIKRCWSFHHAVTQDELNRAYSGWVWKLEYRVPIILNFYFVCLLFSTGMPVLYAIGACAFGITYIVEKFTLLKVANRPPLYKERIAHLVASMLPIGAVLKVAVGIWMLSNHSLTVLQTEEFTVVARILRTIPGIVGILFIVTTLAIWVMEFMMVDFVYRPLSFALTFCCSYGGAIARSHESLHRKYLPGYTEVFALHPSVDYLDPLEEDEWDKLTDQERQDGWVVEADPRGGVVRCKLWTSSVIVHGIKRANGMKKRTWEVMEDDGLHTYNPIANIVYQEAIKQMNDLKGKSGENTLGT